MNYEVPKCIMTEKWIGSNKYGTYTYIKTLDYCPTCKHHVVDLEKHNETKEHRRNGRKKSGNYLNHDGVPRRDEE